MDIDKITKRIINIIKNDYLIDLDEDEEMGLTSDIADILQDKHNEIARTVRRGKRDTRTI